MSLNYTNYVNYQYILEFCFIILTAVVNTGNNINMKMEETYMKMSNMKKNLGSLIGKTAVSVAKIEANAACTYLTYQPKKPDALKKMRKF